ADDADGDALADADRLDGGATAPVGDGMSMVGMAASAVEARDDASSAVIRTPGLDCHTVATTARPVYLRSRVRWVTSWPFQMIRTVWPCTSARNNPFGEWGNAPVTGVPPAGSIFQTVPD